MARDGGIDIEPGILTRVAQGLRWVVGGKAPDDWFGPMDPLPPSAQQVIGRQFDYPSGYNLVTQPRQSEPITFEQLRGLADAYDLMRLAIETRKDQIAKLGWIIRPRIGTDGHPRTGHDDPRIAQASEFFARPDREHGWDSWLRMLVEDMLVIDAATVYPRRDLAGRLLALEPIDGATIKRVLDDRGRTPEPPYPAYQQILKGLPAVDYKADELYYLPRNVRSHRVYGYSPVEQVVMTVNIALRRQMHQLQYYTEGNVPEALIGVPEAWTPDQIGQFQSYWDALLEGDTAQRRHARFVPATISKSFVQTKDAGLKDDYDEWLARIVCFAFSISPQALVKAMNRATAETAHDQALQEGLLPLMRWVKELVDRALREGFGWGDLEFAWQEANEVDPLTQAKIAQVYLAAGVLTPAEVRAGLGLGAEGKGGAANAGRPFGKLVLPPDLSGGGRGGNPYHDARGRFTTADNTGDASAQTLENRGGSGRYRVILTAGGVEDDEEVSRRGVPESLNETADSETYYNLEAELRQIEPNNSRLSRATSPDWEPSSEEVEEMRDELQEARFRQMERAAREAEWEGSGGRYPQDQMEAARAKLREIDPQNPLLQSRQDDGSSCREPTKDEIQEVRDAYDDKVDEVAHAIANGHAREKHEDEFGGDPGSPLMEAEINDTIRRPTAIRRLPEGRVAYYNKDENIVVIVNPKDSDGGSAYKPPDGYLYFKNMK